MNSFTYGHAQIAAPVSGGLSLRANDTGIPSHVAPLDDVTRDRRENGVSRRVHGIVASLKNARPMRWSTTEQRDMMVLIEVDPAIVSYETVPEVVRFALDGRSREHVPAFRAITHRGPVMLDTFPARSRSKENRQRLIAALTEIYADRNVPYRAFDGSQIRLEPRFGNARWVSARSAYRPSEDEMLYLRDALTGADHRTIAELESELPQVPNVASVVSHMAVLRQLGLDLSAKTPEGIVVSMGPREHRK